MSGSIGIRGACSWHGGVRSSPLGAVALIFSIAVGLVIGKYGALRDWCRARQLKRIHQQAVKANPKVGIMTPYGSLEDYERLLRRNGIDESQIAIEIRKYTASDTN